MVRNLKKYNFCIFIFSSHYSPLFHSKKTIIFCEMSSSGMDGTWSSRRSPVYSKNGSVACSQPLASEIGLSILKKGGNAADAAVAVAAALNVTQPTSTGIGGDAFALFFDAKTKKVKGLNGSGRCPSGLSLDILASIGFNQQNRPDVRSPLWITVPGAAAAWVDIVDQFGSGVLPLSAILEPAIALAEDGFPVAPIAAHYWNASEKLLQDVSPNGHEMLLNGRAPKEGELMRLPCLAATFRCLAENGKKGFYEGPIAQSIVKTVRDLGGVISMEDLKNHVSTQDEPIHVNYRGVDVYEIPPNGQGITALLALNILEGFDLTQMAHNSAQHLHILIETLRVAFADTLYYVADPQFSKVPVDALLSKSYAEQRRKLINIDGGPACSKINHGFPANCSNTVYFCVVDGEGNACSFINSNYMGFGTGIVPKGCGFSLHNRGDNFSLDNSHPNKLEPGKRPYHTIIPGMAVKDGELFGPFGVMGGFMQPQGHVQVLSNMIDFKMGPQQALDAPRFLIDGPLTLGEIWLEDGITEEVRQKLAQMGHKSPRIVTGWPRTDFGTGQIIVRDPKTGVLSAGSDPRNDGQAIGY